MVYRRFKNEGTFLDWVAKNYEDNDIYAVYLNNDPYDDDSYLCDLRNKEVNMLNKMGYLEFLEDGSPYLSKKEALPSAARNVAIFDTCAALLAAFVILPAMAAGGVSCDSSGPGLMFIYLVNVLNGMVGGRIIGVIFFVCVLFAGASSIINLYEVSVAFLQEKFGLNRIMATIIMCAIGCAIAINIQAITSQWMDVVSIYICPLGALLAAIMFFWVAGKDFAEKQVSMGAKKPIGAWFYPLGKYVYCACALIALIAGAMLGGIG